MTSSLFAGIENETTRKTYAARIANLLRLMQWTDVAKVVSNPSRVMKKLAEVYQSSYPSSENATITNHVTAVMALFKHDSDLRCNNPYYFKKWKSMHNKLKDAEKERYMRNEPSEAQASKYVSFGELEAKVAELDASVGSGAEALQAHMERMLLGVMAGMLPKRADLGEVALLVVGRSDKSYAETTKKLDAAKNNYMMLMDATTSKSKSSKSNNKSLAKSELVLNTFKTSKTYSQIREDVPDALRAKLLASIAQHPRQYLFVDTRGEPYRKRNSYAQFVRRTFLKHFGRPAGVTMARHAYINDRIDFNTVSLAERAEIAQKMGHSVGTQSIYKWTTHV